MATVADAPLPEQILALREAVDRIEANGLPMGDPSVRDEIDSLTSDFTAAFPSGGIGVEEQLLNASALKPAFDARALAVRANILSQYGVDVWAMPWNGSELAQAAGSTLGGALANDLGTGDQTGAAGDVASAAGSAVTTAAGNFLDSIKGMAGEMILLGLLLVVAYNWERSK